MHKLSPQLALLCLICSLSGCAIGNHYDYKSVRAPLPHATKKITVAVAAVDRREDLLTSEVQSNYVGMTRNRFGIPFRVYTKSGQPLVVDLSQAVAANLEKSGYQTTALSGFPVSDVAAAKSRLKAAHARRQILITLKQWESDTLIHTDMTTEVKVQVFNGAGQLLAEESDLVCKGLGGNFITPFCYARENLRAETSRMLTRIFSSAKIKSSL